MRIMRNIFAIASTSAASFLVGAHVATQLPTTTTSRRDDAGLKRFLVLPFRRADSTTAAVVATQSPLNVAGPQFEDKPKEFTTTPETKKIHLDELEIWSRPSRAAEIMRFGYPGFDNLRTYEDFVLSYDRRTRTAHWVVEHLSPDRMTYDPSVDRSKSLFQPDTSIHPFFRSQNSDYFRSGYDRGHLAAAANHRKSQKSIDQTFYLTNMSPQVGKGFNRDKWNDLEKHCRRAAKLNPNVYICTGPLYLPHRESDGNFYIKYRVIGQNRVAVPTHFFKVMLIETKNGAYELECYLMPNAPIPDETPIANFLVPLDVIERPAGFLIFENMPRDLLVRVNGQPLPGAKTGFFDWVISFFTHQPKAIPALAQE